MPLEPGRLIPNCPRFARRCPTEPCRGEADPMVCDHWNRLATWRMIPAAEQVVRTQADERPSSLVDPRVRDAVNACPDRGSVLPIAAQAVCGCRGGELSECRARRGVFPGKVTLRDCLACQSARVAALSPSCPGAP